MKETELDAVATKIRLLREKKERKLDIYSYLFK